MPQRRQIPEIAPVHEALARIGTDAFARIRDTAPK
jgi:hypothetical protein